MGSSVPFLPSAMAGSQQGGRPEGVVFCLQTVAGLQRPCVWWLLAKTGRRLNACLRFTDLGSSLEVEISEKFGFWLGRVGIFNANPATMQLAVKS